MMQNHVAVCWLALLGLACPGLVASSLLNARGPGARAILEGPRTDRVYCVAYSPDGKTLASAGNFCHDVTERPRRYGGEVLLWDVHTRKVKVQLKPKAGWEDGTSVRAVSFSPDGKTLAAAGRLRYPERPGGGAIILWDVQTGREKASFKGHEREAVWVAFSPDGKTLVSIGYGQEITLWDVEAGKERAGFKGSGYRCCFSPDSKSLAVVRPGMIRTWDVQTGKLALTLPATATCIRYSPDGKTLASGGADSIKLWDVSTGKARAILDHRGVRAVCYSADGGTLASVGEVMEKGKDYLELSLWDARTGKRKADLGREDYSMGHSLAFSPDGKTLALGGDGGVVLWDVPKSK